MRSQTFLRLAAGMLSLLVAVCCQTVSAGDWLGGQYWGHISGCSECGAAGYGGCGAGGCNTCSTMGSGHGCGLGRLFGGGHRCGHGGHYIEGSEPGYNCGCNGSYNYPVPPLYTYHWPGMYKQQLMTNYQSPWRYPPIQPYSDEEPLRGDEPPALPTTQRATPLIPAAAIFELETTETLELDAHRPGSVEPLSEKMKRAFR